MVVKFIGALLFILVTVGCASDSTTPDEEQAEPTPATEVKVQLDWIHTSEYAPFYVAHANGFYEDEGLAVDFIPNDGSLNTLEKVINGDAEFAILGADTLMVARERGEDLVAIASIYQRLPIAYISLEESNITSPQDLPGKSVLIVHDSTTEYAMVAMLQAADVDPDTVTFVQREQFTEEQLLNGDVDVSGVFVTNQIVQMERDNVAINSIFPVDYGVDIYVNTIVARKELVEESPDLVQSFINATLQGMQVSINEPETAVTTTLEWNADLSLEHELASFTKSLPLISPANSRPGEMLPDVWAYTHDLLLTQEILSEPQNVQDIYDMRFVESFYAGE